MHHRNETPGLCATENSLHHGHSTSGISGGATVGPRAASELGWSRPYRCGQYSCSSCSVPVTRPCFASASPASTSTGDSNAYNNPAGLHRPAMLRSIDVLADLVETSDASILTVGDTWNRSRNVAFDAVSCATVPISREGGPAKWLKNKNL
jgi:hypothetical protein